MTREEAKHIVDVAFSVPQAVSRSGEYRTYHEDEIREAKNMAIKALESQDTKSIKVSIDETVLKKLTDEGVRKAAEEIWRGAICRDAISRRAALSDDICEGIGCDECPFKSGLQCKLHIYMMDLPPVIPKNTHLDEWCKDCKEYDKENHCCPRFNRIIKHTVDEVKKEQEPKTGHWIVHPKGVYAHLVCDRCLTSAPYNCETNYCPRCGAKMVE